jgi:catechol 2,3-dioxygenase-like lactoylglutathione lyase family enzyme
MNAETSSRTLPRDASIVPRKLAHLVLKTSNYEPMVDWYLKVLNARVALAAPHVSFLTFDDEHHRIAIVKVPRLAKHDPNTCGMDHIAFTYASMGDLLATYKRLAAQGIRPRWPINHGMTVSFYYQDPDGNNLELQIDSFPTTQELQDYFERDPDYAANPLGAQFDPDELVRKYEAGVPFAELIKLPPPTRSPFAVLQEMGLGEHDI